MIKYYEEQDERNDKLIEILRELSDPKKQDILRHQDVIFNYIDRLKKIYFEGLEEGKKFRHSYARIYQFLYDEMYIADNDSSVLEQNVDILYHFCSENDDNQLAEVLYKLLDHMEMDIVRIAHLKKEVGDIQKDVDLVCDDIKTLGEKSKLLNKAYLLHEKKVQKSQKKINKINDQVENAYSQYISILGIFSAIVLVFFGGTSIFTSFFGNICKLSYQKIAFTLSITGIILFDIIFMFFYILAKLIKRDIATAKPQECIWIKRICIRYPYVVLFHIMMGIIFSISCYSICMDERMKSESSKYIEKNIATTEINNTKN